MGFFDFLPCCGKRQAEVKADEPADTDPLLARPAESITSQEGYGSVSMSAPDGGMSGKQRKRLEDIGREVGNHMLPINQASRASTTSPSVRQPSTARAPSPDSTSSPSRPTTPCPGDREADALAPTASGGDDDDGQSTIATRSGAATPTSVVPDADGVVHKQLFRSSESGGGNSKRGGHGGRGKKGARGRGRGRSKKMNKPGKVKGKGGKKRR